MIIEYRQRQMTLIQTPTPLIESMINLTPSLEILHIMLTGEIDRPSTERVEPVRGCLITQAVWNEPP
jgi:hypothetical protein